MERTVKPRKQIEAPKSLNELTQRLAEMYADVSNDRAMVPQADAAANVAGKIINIAKLQLDAARYAGGPMLTEQKQWMLGNGGEA
jgi:hypothetical protein